MNKNKGFWKGTIVGAAIGSIAALLLAPKSGKETQEDIKRRARSMKHDMDRVLKDLTNELTGRIDDLKDVAKDLKGEAQEESKALIHRAEGLKKDLQESAANLGRAGSQVKDGALTDARRLVDEGAGVISELERLTKTMISSAKDKMKQAGEKGESGHRDGHKD